MSYETIISEKHGDARVVRFNRPERRNAFNIAMLTELSSCLADTSHRDARTIILSGGELCFSSGRDLKEAAQMGDTQSAVKAFAALAEIIATHELPVIAAIEGPCLTGGLELALCCDLRIAGRGSSFAITSAKLGTLPGFGATQRLPRLVGVSAALEILFAADILDAEAAWQMGLLNKLVDSGKALDSALDLASIYADRAPLSMAAIKSAVRQGMESSLGDGLLLESKLGQTLVGTADRKEGIRAFFEKRSPRFSGN